MNLSAESYRGIIFILTWSLILEILSVFLLLLTGEYFEMVVIISILALITGILLVFFVEKARRAMLEELE